MRALSAVMLVVALTLISCTPDVRMHTVASEQLTIVTIVEDRRMAILLLDDGQSIHMDGGAVHHFDDSDLATLTAVLLDLAIVMEVDGSGQAMVDLLRLGATTLRKTRLVDTLAKVTGDGDSLSELARMKSAQLFDVRGRIKAEDRTEEWLTRYIAEVRRYMRRR